MRKSLMSFCALLLSLSFNACVSVSSTSMIGDSAFKIDDPAQWEGAWSDGEELVYHVMVKDPDAGLLRVAVVEPRKQDADFALKAVDVAIRKSEDALFLNILFADVADDQKQGQEELLKTFLWMLVEHKDNTVFIFLPDPQSISTLLEEGGVQGEKGDGHIMVKGSQEELNKLFDPSSGNKFYMWRNPIPLRKISRP